MESRSIQFFASTVKPVVDEFFADVQNIRRGRLAAIVLYHLADYWLLEGGAHYGSLQSLHKALIHECPDFHVIRDVADASKHATLRAQKEIPRRISTADQISRPEGLFGAPFGTAVFNEASFVTVTLDDGTERPLAGAVRSVLQMWEAKL